MSMLSTSVLAHHGNTEFDMGTQRRVNGTLTDIIWGNPHIILTLATQNTEGDPVSLEIEAGSPSVLRVGGFNRQSLVVGETVTALVSPSRRFPEETSYGYEITKADGSVVPLVGAGIRRPQTNPATDSLFSTWVSTAQSFTNFVRPLRTWPLNDEASAIRARFTPVESGQARCVPVAAPMVMLYPLVTAFEEKTDHILFTSEWLGAQRLFYTDGRGHPPISERYQQGHSIGRWEGETLVVDTMNFTDQETGGVPSGSQRHLVERFTLADGGRALHYAYVLEDPQYLTAAVTGEGEYRHRPDLQLTQSDCDLELAQRFFREFE